MKFKKLMLVSLILLAILTIGAVSASADSDALAVQDDAGDGIDSSVDGTDIISTGDDDDDDGDDGDDGDDDGDDLDDGDDDNETEGELIIGDENPNMNAAFPENIVSGEKFTVNVTFNLEMDNDAYLESDFNGEVELYIDGCYEDSFYAIPIYDGESHIKGFTALVEGTVHDMGTHTIEVYYPGDETYKNVSESKTYEITQYVIAANVQNAYYGEVAEINFIVPSTYEGNFTVTINGKERTPEYYSNDEYCGYILEVSDLEYGINNMTYIYDALNGTVTAQDIIDVKGNINVPEVVCAIDDVVSLKLPKDANGELKIWIYQNEDYSLVASEVINDGYVEIPVSHFISALGNSDDYYATYDGDEKYQNITTELFSLSLIPKVEYPEFIISGDGNEYYVIVTVPEANSGTVSLYKEPYMDDDDSDDDSDDDDDDSDDDDYEDDNPDDSDDDYGDDEDLSGYELVGSVETDNGVAKIKLPALSQDTHFVIRYSDDSGNYNYTLGFDIEAIDVDDVVDTYIEGTAFIKGDEIEIYYTPSRFFNGTVNVCLDGDLINTTVSVLDDDEVCLTLNTTDMAFGAHTLRFETIGNINTTKTVTFEISNCIIEFYTEDGQMNIESAWNFASVRLNEGANGTIRVIVNGKVHEEIPVDSDYFDIDLSDLEMRKNYDVNISYFDSEGNLVTSKSDSVTFYYVMSTSMDEYEDDSVFFYGEENIIEIYLPYGVGNGDLIVKIDDEAVKWKTDDDGIVYVDISDFEIGDYEFYVKYTGDAKFYANERYIDFEVKANIGGMEDYNLAGEEITLELPSDAEGNLVIEVYDYYEDENGEYVRGDTPIMTKEIPLVNGKASGSLEDMDLGEYYVVAYYDGDDYDVEPVEDYFVFKPVFDFGDEYNLHIGDECTISVEVSGNGNFTVNVYKMKEVGTDLEGEPIYEYEIINSTVVAVKNNRASWILKPAQLGQLLVNVTYSENGEVLAEAEETFDVVPVVDLEFENIYNTNSSITFEVAPDDNDGEVIFTFLDDDNNVVANVSASLENGKAVADIPNLPIGHYHALINYTGKYGSSTTEEYFEIIPLITMPTEIKDGEDAVVEFEMEGAEGNFTVIVGGKTYETQVVNGKGNVTIPKEELSSGSNTVQVSYVGNDGSTYKSHSSASGPVSSKNMISVKSTPELTVKDNAPTASSDLIITVTLNDKFTSGNVTVTVNNKNYTATFENGAAVVNAGKLPANTYPVTVTYNGNSKYTPVTKKVDVKVYYDPKIVAKNAAIFYMAGQKYSVTVYGKDGKIAKDTQVVFKVNGKKFKTVKTNKKGVASVVLTQLPKTYKVTAQALGKSVTTKVTIKPILTLNKVKVKKSAKKLVIKASLKKVNGKFLKGKKITLKFNGKKITAKTNKKGVAKFTIGKKFLKKLKVGKKSNTKLVM